MLRRMTNYQPDFGFALKSNCLLTRRPLVFLTPTRSLFFYKNPWGRINHILFEHGYKTLIFQLPFQNIELKKVVLRKNIHELSKKHLFMDCVTYETLKIELLQIQSSTITVIGLDSNLNQAEKTNLFNFECEDSKLTIGYWLHQKWCRFLGIKTPPYKQMLNQISKECWSLFLDHCFLIIAS